MTIRCDYQILLEGVDALDLPLSILRDLCDLLTEGSQRAVRLAVEGRSVVPGTVPSWVTSAADLRLAKYERGSLDLSISVPFASEAAPEMFVQQQLFGSVPDVTALDLLLEAADDAVHGRRDSERLDTGMLEILTRAGGLFARGSTKLCIARAGATPVVIDSASARAIEALADQTPSPRVTRARGVLDTLTVSTRRFVLKIDGGKTLRGLAGSLPIDALKDLLGTHVVVEGLVTFRPSGDALRIEADYAAPAKDGDLVWAKIPRVEPRTQPEPSAPDIQSWFGRWPGEEGDDEIFRVLEELS